MPVNLKELFNTARNLFQQMKTGAPPASMPPQQGYAGQPAYPPQQGYPQPTYGPQQPMSPQQGGVNPLLAGGVGAVAGGLAGYGLGQVLGEGKRHIEPHHDDDGGDDSGED